MIIHISVRVLGFLAVALMAVACGSSEPSLNPSSFCTEKAIRECGTTGSMGVADRCVINADTECKPARAALCEEWTNRIQLESGVSRPFNRDRANECLAKTSEVYKKAAIVPADLAALQTVCERTFSGAKKNGDACASDFECGGTLVCDVVCAAKTTLAKGMFCGSVPGAACGPGLYCATAAGQPIKMCLDRPTEGQACAADMPCLETLRCLATTSTCAARLAVSQPCASNDDCAAAAPYCDPFVGNRCDTGFIPSPGTPECTTFGAPVP